MFTKLLELSPFRRWTDRKAYCAECRAHVGYVVWSNRDEWTCDVCAKRDRPYVVRGNA